MISVPGTIQIRCISGRFGNFNTGTLKCSLGTFSVKDASIEEFDEGSYSGDFLIEEIKPGSYTTSSGGLVIEVRATLNKIILHKGVLPEPVEPQQFEQDPIEEVIHSNISPAAPELMSPLTNVAVDSPEEGEALFQYLWPLGKVVKLDSTINRALLRKQISYLNLNGYEFVASEQRWVKE